MNSRLLVRAEKHIAFTDDGCWTWTASTNRNGYAQIGSKTETTLAHRAVYMALVEPVPKGVDLHHICKNRLCVNPDHLEPVAHATNIALDLASEQTIKYSYVHPETGKRRCRICDRAWKPRGATT